MLSAQVNYLYLIHNSNEGRNIILIFWQNICGIFFLFKSNVVVSFQLFLKFYGFFNGADIINLPQVFRKIFEQIFFEVWISVSSNFQFLAQNSCNFQYFRRETSTISYKNTLISKNCEFHKFCVCVLVLEGSISQSRGNHLIRFSFNLKNSWIFQIKSNSTWF